MSMKYCKNCKNLIFGVEEEKEILMCPECNTVYKKTDNGWELYEDCESVELLLVGDDKEREKILNWIVDLISNRTQLEELLIAGVITDGAHHKQYILEEIAKIFKLILPNHEKGIAT